MYTRTDEVKFEFKTTKRVGEIEQTFSISAIIARELFVREPNAVNNMINVAYNKLHQHAKAEHNESLPSGRVEDSRVR